MMHTRPKPCGWATRRAGVRGFSLIEVLIAMAILAIGMVGVVSWLTAAVDLHKRGVDQTSAALLADTILELKQSEALAGFSPDELSTRNEEGEYFFKRSDIYRAYECKIICTALNDREYKMILEVRTRPLVAREEAASDTKEESGNVRFETILLAGG